MLYLQDKDVLSNAIDLYTENKSEIVSIAERQKSIRTGSLREYARLTRNLCPKECEQDELSEALLQVVVQKILDENPKMSGISDGKMGYVLWLSLYNRLTANGRVSQKISELWQCIKEDIDMRLLPLNFRNGLLGIGWGLIYMQEYGFLDDDPCELLECIDGELQQLSVEKVYETSVDFGLGGVYAYVNARILNSKKDAGACFEKSFLEALHRKAQFLLCEGLEDHLAIYQMIKFEMWTTCKESADQKLDCSEWMTYKSFVPANIMYAEKGLSGNLMSTTFQKMSLILKFSYQ